MASGLGDITATYGSGAAATNLAILVTETANQLPAGVDVSFTSLVNYGIGTAGAADATMVDTFYKQSITSGDISGGNTVLDSGDHQNAVLLTFSGHDTGTAPNWLAAGQSGTATTTVAMTQSNGSYTNVKAGDVLLATIATDADTDTNLSLSSISWGNVTGTSSIVHNDTDSTGAGGGIIVVQLLVTADATAAITFGATITSTIYSAVMLHIKKAP